MQVQEQHNDLHGQFRKATTAAEKAKAISEHTRLTRNSTLLMNTINLHHELDKTLPLALKYSVKRSLEKRRKWKNVNRAIQKLAGLSTPLKPKGNRQAPIAIVLPPTTDSKTTHERQIIRIVEKELKPTEAYITSVIKVPDEKSREKQLCWYKVLRLELALVNPIITIAFGHKAQEATRRLKALRGPHSKNATPNQIATLIDVAKEEAANG